jgi:hypothetical protein
MNFLAKHFFFSFCLWSGASIAAMSSQWDGDYKVEQYGEKLIDGTQVYLQYNLKIDSQNEKATVIMSSWHAPISCIGNYDLKNESGRLILYYSSNNEKSDCIYSSPQFEMKMKGKGYYIKGSVFAYSSPGEWLLLKKEK